MSRRDINGRPFVPGFNVDPVDTGAGIRKAMSLGYDDAESLMVIEYALRRHARGEEEGAERTILGCRVDFTSWRVILAAAIVAGQEGLSGQESAQC